MNLYWPNKYKGIEQEDMDIPGWHKDIIRQRLEDYQKHPDSALDFDGAMVEIEKEL